jgi:hypothetical protein
MKPLQLNVFFAFFPYSGNGGYSSEHPSIRRWFADTLLKAKRDPRVGEVWAQDFCDTPIPMTRNAAVLEARKKGADLILMCDSDQWPDWELQRGEPGARPFWDSSFDFLHQHYAKGPAVIGAPYCGPPPHENVYVFRFANQESGHANVDVRLAQYTREEAAGRGGIENVAALPTGLIVYDLRCFALLAPPYFYYEWEDLYQSKKASTEDVTNTRDICVHGVNKLGYNPVYVNWDAWAGHLKPKVVGKPRPPETIKVGEVFRRAANCSVQNSSRLVMVGEGQVDPAPKVHCRNGA